MEQVRKFGAGFTLIGCSRLKIDKPALGVNVSSIRPNGMSDASNPSLRALPNEKAYRRRRHRDFYPEIGSTPKTGCAALIIFSYQLKKKERLILCARKSKVRVQGIAPHSIGRKTSLLKKLYLGTIPLCV